MRSEYELTRAMLLEVSEAEEIAQRFSQLRARLQRKLPTIGRANRLQVELLRRYRGSADPAERERYKAPLLLSINGIAAGLGSIG